MYSYYKNHQDVIFLNFILVIGICHTSYVDSLLAWSGWTVNITSMTNTICCEYSIKTPDDGQ